MARVNYCYIFISLYLLSVPFEYRNLCIYLTLDAYKHTLFYILNI